MNHDQIKKSKSKSNGDKAQQSSTESEISTIPDTNKNSGMIVAKENAEGNQKNSNTSLAQSLSTLKDLNIQEPIL